jgi:hypothetical protein
MLSGDQTGISTTLTDVTLDVDPQGRFVRMRLDARRGGSVCLNTVRGASKWIGRSFQAAAGIGVARLVYA